MPSACSTVCFSTQDFFLYSMTNELLVDHHRFLSNQYVLLLHYGFDEIIALGSATEKII